MIEPLLFFALGLLAAAFIWLLLLPAFWRRATRISRRALEQSLPLTPNEITAERDRLRARFAVEAALSARREEKARADLVAARAETGERLRAEAEHLSTIAARERLLADREVELTTLREQVAALEGELADLRVAKQFAETTIAGSSFSVTRYRPGTMRPWTLPRNAACISRKRAAKPRTSVRPSPRKPVAPLNCAPNSSPARLPA